MCIRDSVNTMLRAECFKQRMEREGGLTMFELNYMLMQSYDFMVMALSLIHIWCGKSTLFNLMTKNLRPQSGSILLGQEDVVHMKMKEFAKQVAIVHQYNTAPSDLTVEKLVSYGRTPYQTMGFSADAAEDEEKIRWAMEITEMIQYREKPVSQLSGGQKQRVWIAMSLAQNTKVLFLDEPTTYLDIKYQLQVLDLILLSLIHI